MDGFIMMEQFEIGLPETQNKGNDKNKQENSLECKKMTDFIGNIRGLLHAAPSVF